MSNNRTAHLSRIALVAVTALLAATASAAPPAKVSLGTVYTTWGQNAAVYDLTGIVSMNLPAGRYAISANAQVDNSANGYETTVHCYLRGGVGPSQDQSRVTVPAGGRGVIALLTTAEMTSGFADAAVVCESLGSVYMSSRMMAQLVPAIIQQ